MTTDPSTDTCHGQPAVQLAIPAGDRATVLLHGAHVVGWTTPGGTAPAVERLYLSPTTGFGAGAAIRGGVPVVFPQFNQRGPDTGLPKHGIARTRAWAVADQAADRVTLQLTDDDATRALWPHRFALRLTVTLEPGALQLALEASNTGPGRFGFTAALHTYLAVGDIAATTVAGLAGAHFLDTVVDRTGVAGAEPLAFGGETDRIYWDAAAPLTVQSPLGALQVTMQGFQDVVVWNPWVARARALPDLPDDDWRRMLCIEAAQIGRPVDLAPQARWHGVQRLALVPSRARR
ncbi:MAG: D-hexose-6-phosphate mutarotase [Lautropia sp.]